MRIIYSNVDGLISKLNEFNDYIDEHKPDIICVTETKLHQSLNNEVLRCTGYNIWQKNRQYKTGGRLMILTADTLRVK